jgi:hypothetical protein
MKDMSLSSRDINAADFGLDGSDETDCTPAINAALKYAATFSPVGAHVGLLVLEDPDCQRCPSVLEPLRT